MDKKEFESFEVSVQRGIEIITYLETLDMKYEVSHGLTKLYEHFTYELGRAKIARNESVAGSRKW